MMAARTKRPKKGLRRDGGGRRQKLRRNAYAHKLADTRCCDKATFISKAAAVEAAAAQSNIRGHKMAAYRCPEGRWHLTTNIQGLAHG